jgi:hypothetical protein
MALPAGVVVSTLLVQIEPYRLSLQLAKRANEILQ